jgi:UDP-glucuronate 4-epimerase
MSILVTGAAGFIGFHVASRLCALGETVIGLDNLSDYYSVALKKARLSQLESLPGFVFHKLDIADRDGIAALFAAHGDITRIIHLAAQAGVRYSLQNPYTYVETNVMGQVTLLEGARRLKRLERFVYASSSSVYGANKKQPFSVDDPVNSPMSLYAATKRSCELVTHTYSHLYGMPCLGLRFFTVYGPWGRPDMAAYLFTDAIMAGRPIEVFNEGRMARDFTYIDDIAAGTIAALDHPTTLAADGPPHRIYNLGNRQPEKLTDFIAIIEKAIGRKAEMLLLPMQPGDVVETFADIEPARRDLGFEPRTPIAEGLPRFVAWYKEYHGIG